MFPLSGFCSTSCSILTDSSMVEADGWDRTVTPRMFVFRGIEFPTQPLPLRNGQNILYLVEHLNLPRFRDFEYADKYTSSS